MIMTQALGWALVDSLWQNALAAAGLAALLAVIPVRAARARYALATLTLALMLVFPLASAVRLSGTSTKTSDVVTATSPVAPGPTSPGPRAVPPAPTPAPAILATPVAASIRGALEPALPWVVLVWFGGVVALSLRLASGWLLTRQLGSVGTSSVPDSCVEAVTRLAARLRITRPVRVLESAVVHVPAVIGWLRPVILLPASALTGLTPLQLDALLAHELAHVRRYDYVVNLLQSVVETLLFYHPAVWWVSGRVREEREHCCDDLAVAVCGDAHFYATALLGMERLRVATPAFALAASGGGRGDSLMGRIRRLVAPVQTEIFPRWMAGVVVVSLALGGGAHLVSGSATQGDTPNLATTQDTALRRIQALRDPDVREDSVKALGKTQDPRALVTLIAIARHDREEDVQREAVEAMGRLKDGAGVDALLDIARTHPNAEVRREAVKAVGEAAPTEVALVELQVIINRDRDEDVRQEAVDALGDLRTPHTLVPLAHLARAHPSAAVREEALQEYAQAAPPEAALKLLTDRLANDRASTVQEEAVERLAKLPDGIGIPAVVDAARHHPASDVRREAEKRLAKMGRPLEP
jgi:beta-lactamase regulating signal transducer with metallopeptidase domain/HEAT repeat protein